MSPNYIVFEVEFEDKNYLGRFSTGYINNKNPFSEVDTIIFKNYDTLDNFKENKVISTPLLITKKFKIINVIDTSETDFKSPLANIFFSYLRIKEFKNPPDLGTLNNEFFNELLILLKNVGEFIENHSINNSEMITSCLLEVSNECKNIKMNLDEKQRSEFLEKCINNIIKNINQLMSIHLLMEKDKH